MIGQIEVTSTSVFTRFAAAFVFIVSVVCSACAAELISVTASSGVSLPCHSYYRVDAKGKEWPITIQFTARPKNGTATTQSFYRPVSVNGQVRTVRAVKVFYQSKKGFVGQDTFTYRRISGDPTDPDNKKEYTIAVTVR
jgi:hypothetical protein